MKKLHGVRFRLCIGLFDPKQVRSGYLENGNFRINGFILIKNFPLFSAKLDSRRGKSHTLYDTVTDHKEGMYGY